MVDAQNVKDTLSAIESVKRRIKIAENSGSQDQVHRLMGDLYALEACLVIESQKLVDKLEVEDESQQKAA